MARIDRYVLGFALALVSATANASQIDLSGAFSPQVNANLLTYSSGFNYPTPASNPLNVNGVNFNLAVWPEGTGVVQTNGDSFTFDLSTYNLAGVTSIYTLINSAFGIEGFTVGRVTFTGSLNSAAYDLVEGVNIRDHYCCGGYNEIATNLAGTATFGSGTDTVRLDMQQFSVAGLGTLQTMTFEGFNALNDNFDHVKGQPFLAGLTAVDAVPEPSTWAMMILGFAGLGFMAYRRRGAALAA
jgi:hypothetical protein